MRRTKEDAELTRQQLLKAALTVFSRKGYAETRLEDIAAEANVTRGALYHHFAGKAELYNTLIAQTSTRIVPIINEAINRGGTALEVLHRLLVVTLHFVADDADYRAVNELVLFKTALTPELAEGMRMKQEGTQRFIEFLAEIITGGINRGELRADLDPHLTAIGLISYQNGLILSWLMNPSLFSLRQQANALAALAIEGLMKK